MDSSSVSINGTSTSLFDETTISWSGTLTLVSLFGIGPLIYLGLYIIKVMKQRNNNDDNDGNKNKGKEDQEVELDAVGVKEKIKEGEKGEKEEKGEEAEKKKLDSGEDKDNIIAEAIIIEDNIMKEDNIIKEDDNGSEGENWTSTQYLFSLIGYAIGIGNVWRFCYVIAQDGGSASLFGTYQYTVLLYRVPYPLS